MSVVLEYEIGNKIESQLHVQGVDIDEYVGSKFDGLKESIIDLYFAGILTEKERDRCGYKLSKMIYTEIQRSRKGDKVW